MSRNLKLVMASIVIFAFAVIVIYFAVWGIYSSINRKLGHTPVVGTYKEQNWSNSDIFKLSDYKTIKIADDKDAKILTLSDLHYKNWGWQSEYVFPSDSANKRTHKDVKYLIEITKPDLIVVTGDLITCSFNDVAYRKFSEFIDEFNIPWTVVFGNHDAETRADKPALLNIMQEFDNCITVQGPTNLKGLGNTIINLVNSKNEIINTLIIMDTGDMQNDAAHLERAGRGENKFSTTDYGYNDAQGAWYSWVIDGLAKANNGKAPKSIIFSHIALQAYHYAVEFGAYNYGIKPYDTECFFSYETSFKGTDKELSAEAFAEYKYNDAFYKLVKEKNSTIAFVTGHNHSFGYDVLYDGIKLIGVIKTGNIYAAPRDDNGNRGGTLLTISQDGDLTSQLYYATKDNKRQY